MAELARDEDDVKPLRYYERTEGVATVVQHGFSFPAFVELCRRDRLVEVAYLDVAPVERVPVAVANT